MNVVLGASGRVGSAIVAELLSKGEKVKAIVRDEQKGEALRQQGAKVVLADVNDYAALSNALTGADTVFVLTPESGTEENVLEETRHVLDNYRKAIGSSLVRRVVGLSSIGAQHESGTGNLIMSNMLEHAFDGLNVQKLFIRPAYYFSNWMGYIDSVKNDGVLPSFYPVDQSISMILPQDVGKFVADVMASDSIEGNRVYEIEGPEHYTPAQVAAAFGEALGKSVKAEQIPPEKWEGILKGIGFSDDGVHNFIEMTNAVIE
jgi:uncharacterized protein YbjT (DUF2867 family)